MNMLTEKDLRLTEEEVLSVAPHFKDRTPEKMAELIEFVYQISLVLYRSCANSQGSEGDKA
ncbi:hypothetical protein DCM91_03555 [Chitinophaga costaii]|nr:hypothetical protein DCM91_03555 [Chitinophaga costaii]